MFEEFHMAFKGPKKPIFTYTEMYGNETVYDQLTQGQS